MVQELGSPGLVYLSNPPSPPQLDGWVRQRITPKSRHTHTGMLIGGVERSDGKHTWMSELIVSWIQSLLVAHGVKQVGKLRPPRHAGHEQLIARKAHLAVKKRRTREKSEHKLFMFAEQKKSLLNVKKERRAIFSFFLRICVSRRKRKNVFCFYFDED